MRKIEDFKNCKKVRCLHGCGSFDEGEVYPCIVDVFDGTLCVIAEEFHTEAGGYLDSFEPIPDEVKFTPKFLKDDVLICKDSWWLSKGIAKNQEYIAAKDSYMGGTNEMVNLTDDPGTALAASLFAKKEQQEFQEITEANIVEVLLNNGFIGAYAPKKLISLEDHEIKVKQYDDETEARKWSPSGIECPECKAELLFFNKQNGFPPDEKYHAKCSGCNYTTKLRILPKDEK